MRYVDKHESSSARPADRRLQRPDGASDPATPPALLEPDHRGIQRLRVAAYRNRSPQRGHQYNTIGWDSKTAAHSWFSTNRMTAPNPDLPKLYSPAAVQATTVRTTAGASKQQARRIQVYPDRTQKLAIATWLTASRWTYNLTVEILQSGIPAVWKHIASMVMPEVKELHSRMGFRPLPGEAHSSPGRLPGHEQRQDLQHGTQVPPGTRQQRADQEFANLGYRSRKNPKTVMLHTRRRRDGAWRLSHYARTAADGRSHGRLVQGARPLLWCRLVQERGRY